MVQDQTFAELMARLRAGDNRATELVMERFTKLIIAIAQRRLTGALRQKFDAEDVLQSVFSSFFKRQAKGSLIVENWDMVRVALVNLTRRDGTLLDTMIRLRQDTTAAQMQSILDAIRTLLLADPDVDHDTVRVRFKEVGDYALGIGVRAHMKPTHHSAFLEAQERILFGIIRIVEENGAALALPAHRAYYLTEPPHAAAPRKGAAKGDVAAAPRMEGASSAVTPSLAEDDEA